RRSRAPIAPGVVHASATLRIRRLYSAVDVRRRGFATTCTSSAPTATCVSIGSSLLALTNFGGRDCLTHPGTEGGAPVTSLARVSLAEGYWAVALRAIRIRLSVAPPVSGERGLQRGGCRRGAMGGLSDGCRRLRCRRLAWASGRARHGRREVRF